MARKRNSPSDDSDADANISTTKRVKPSDPVSSAEPSWDLNASGSRRITVSEFKGKMMVGIREFYEKDGVKLPGKKGISLPTEQWIALVEALPEIEKVLKEKGETTVRPQYTGEREPEDEAVKKETTEAEESTSNPDETKADQ